jgi:hypothetical protein
MEMVGPSLLGYPRLENRFTNIELVGKSLGGSHVQYRAPRILGLTPTSSGREESFWYNVVGLLQSFEDFYSRQRDSHSFYHKRLI